MIECLKFILKIFLVPILFIIYLFLTIAYVASMTIDFISYKINKFMGL